MSELAGVEAPLPTDVTLPAAYATLTDRQLAEHTAAIVDQLAVAVNWLTANTQSTFAVVNAAQAEMAAAGPGGLLKLLPALLKGPN